MRGDTQPRQRRKEGSPADRYGRQETANKGEGG
jgi:hypothetical protein